MASQQPDLHDLVCLVRAPAFLLSRPDGQVDEDGPQGLFVADRRVLSRFRLRVDGVEPQPLAHELPTSGDLDVALLVRRDDQPDPLGHLDVQRRRTLRPDGFDEVVELVARTDEPVEVRVEVDVACDLAGVADVKAGRPSVPVPWEVGDRLTLGDDVRVGMTGPGVVEVLGSGFVTTLVLRPDQPQHLTVDVTATEAADPAVVPPARPAPWRPLTVTPEEGPLAAMVQRSMLDLDALRLADPLVPEDEFFAAGAPWYLTLFGRDSLWAARMALPLGTDVAAGTLRALARRQGRANDAETEEQPGKILHELRAEAVVHGEPSTATGPEPLSLPPLYYGTVDATALWVLLLHDAWRWGLPHDEVEGLLQPLERALAWVRSGSLDERGFLSYQDRTGHGLANQGWKDSPDAIVHADGSCAAPPVALAEVQGYAYEAAVAGAALLDAFGRPGADECRTFAAGLADRFRAGFWVSDDRGPFPAVALDGAGRPAATVTSNIGHLLGTGILSAEEERLVAARLADPTMSSGYGLRTLASDAVRYDPLSYHRGSVWTHDTAIAVFGLARSGASPEALGVLVEGLLAAGPHFGFQMPELYGGQPLEQGTPVPYPSSCRPQAWAAATGVLLAGSLAGVRPDVPAGQVVVRPAAPSPVGPFAVRGIDVAGVTLDVEVDARGVVSAAWREGSPLRLAI